MRNKPQLRAARRTPRLTVAQGLHEIAKAIRENGQVITSTLDASARIPTITRFTKLDQAGDSAIALDQTTGLLWSKTLNTTGKSHADCVKLVEELEAKEKKGWRMPTVEELFLIVDRTRKNPAIDTDAFPDTKSDWYWSGTPVAGVPSTAWYVNFSSGSSDWSLRLNLGFVRAVRAGQ